MREKDICNCDQALQYKKALEEIKEKAGRWSTLYAHSGQRADLKTLESIAIKALDTGESQASR